MSKEKERYVTVAITEASYSGNKGAAAMLESSVSQLIDRYGDRLKVLLFSVWPKDDKRLVSWDCVNIISAEPWKVVFIAFPLSILFWMFHWIPPIRVLLLKNSILSSFYNTDIVLDEAGVSFVDSRGFMMNTYAFICMSIPLLMKKPIVKYSQALGSFNGLINRLQAKLILPKMKLIIARGELTKNYLKDIGVVDNVRFCTDGAFSMRRSENMLRFVNDTIKGDDFYSDKPIVGVSPSTVVKNKCNKIHIEYIKVMSESINALIEEGFNVLILSNASREGCKQERNNDLYLCNEIFNNCIDKRSVRFYFKEMRPDEILEYMGKCRYVIASRFHAMIFALMQKKPVLLIGWSHKYQEVLDYFNLGRFAIDYSSLTVKSLLDEFHNVLSLESDIYESIEKSYDEVLRSSYQNIELVSEIIDSVMDINLE